MIRHSDAHLDPRHNQKRRSDFSTLAGTVSNDSDGSLKKVCESESHHEFAVQLWESNVKTPAVWIGHFMGFAGLSQQMAHSAPKLSNVFLLPGFSWSMFQINIENVDIL